MVYSVFTFIFLYVFIRYEASLVLRRSCLGELVLGDVLKILEIIITVKKWIIIHPQSGWQPITISLSEIEDDD